MPKFDDDATYERHADLARTMTKSLQGLTVYEAARILNAVHYMVLKQATPELQLRALITLAEQLGHPTLASLPDKPKAFRVPGNNSIN